MSTVGLTEIGQIIRMIRKSRGLRLEDLADENISPATISNVERGVAHVKQEKVTYLFDKLQISMDKLPEMILNQKEELKREKFSLFAIESLRDSGFPELALEKVKQLELEDQHPLAAYAYLIKGKCFNSLEIWRRAERAFLDAIRLSQTSLGKHSNIEAAAFNGLALCSYSQNELEQAITYTNSGLHAIVDDGERIHYRYVLLQNKAMFLEKMGRPVEALKVVQDAWEYIPEIKHVEVLLGLYWLRAELLRKTRDYDESIYYAMEGLELARLNHDNCRSCDLWITLGSTYMSLNRWSEAETCFELALKQEGKFSNHQVVSTAHARIGLLYIQKEQLELAKDHIHKAIEKAQETQDTLRLLYALTIMGHYYQKRNNQTEAAAYFKQSLNLARKYQYKNKEQIALFKLAQCLESPDQMDIIHLLRSMDVGIEQLE
ncbi:helix-turn-helix domain-containing protein [Kroppenstedtia eburnea]|uniref:helix-turn-helix domain-containing protein n=1 Tax=Kroppenstedtia eburnea TaxID=714067 RepID=UPI003631E5D7